MRARAVRTHEQQERERGQVVVAEEEDSTADKRARFVDREQSPQLRIHCAMALVELEPGGRPATDGLR